MTYNRRLCVLAGCWLTMLTLMLPTDGQAQAVLEAICRDRNVSASNYRAYPDTITRPLTPPPGGKRPFYISHYGRHGSRNLSQRKAYDIPYHILNTADSLGKLTPMGYNVLQEVATLRSKTEERWGDLTPLGSEQHRHIARRMMERFPEVFEGAANIDARSTVKQRCILSMGAALSQMIAINPQLRIKMDASKHDMWYLNHQDRQLRDSMMTYAAKKAYDEFVTPREKNLRLMQELFNDMDYVSDCVNDEELNYFLFKTASILQNTPERGEFSLYDIFTSEEIYHIWQKENSWWYITYGPSLLNGGQQPYTQRHLLRQIINEADSCLRLYRPGVTLRYGHETVILPLVCLLNLNGYGYATNDLEQVEQNGWWAFSVFPMAANLQFIFYRRDINDKDVLVQVLLNENEASLPIPTDCAPYYHWTDVRQYYLKKIDDYENTRR